MGTLHKDRDTRVAGMTVAEAQAVLPPGTTLLGGAAGLSRGVTSTATFRARTPAFPALRGGELALVSLPLLRQVDPGARLDRLVAQLAAAGVAAIVLLEAGDAAGLVDAASGAAEAHALPVLAVPPGYTAEAIDLELHRQLAGRREALLQRRAELQQQFAQLALAGQGPAAIVEQLAAVTGLPAAWESAATLEPLAWAEPAEGWSARELAAGLPSVLRAARLPLQRWARSLVPGEPATVAMLPVRADAAGDASPWRRLVVPVHAAGQVTGFLSVIARAPASPGAEQGVAEVRIALDAAGLAASIEAFRARTAQEAQGGAVAGLVHDWIGGRYATGAELQARAAHLGVTLVPPFAVIVVASDPPPGPDVRRLLAGTVAGAAPAGRPAPATPGAEVLWTMVDDRRQAMVVPLPDGMSLDAAAGALHDALAALDAQPVPAERRLPRRPNGKAHAEDLALPAGVVVPAIGQREWTMGEQPAPSGRPPFGAVPAIGQPTGAMASGTSTLLLPHQRSAPRQRQPAGAMASGTSTGSYAGIGRAAARVEDVPRAYTEALQALEVARRLGGRHRAAYFGALGVYRVLAATEPQELASFHDDVLGALREHDEKSGGELLRTLEMYLLCGSSPQETALRLHTHRNTVLYRLDRIAQVLGRDVRDPETQLTLFLALRAREVLGAPRTPPVFGHTAERRPWQESLPKPARADLGAAPVSPAVELR